MREWRGLSLYQPYASLIASGGKAVESRSWSTSYRGWLAIQATERFPEECRALCEEEPFRLYVPEWRLLPRSAVVAVARLKAVQRADDYAANRDEWEMWGDELKPHELEFGDYSAGRWAWILDDVTPLRRPLPCVGARGLWRLPLDLERRLDAMLDGQEARAAQLTLLDA